MTYDRSTVMTRDVPIGTDVYTTDGDKLGQIAEFKGSAFRVDVAMKPDYWLPLSATSTSTGNRVTLTFHKDHLGDYKMDEPRAA